jgi:hypothetical protein
MEKNKLAFEPFDTKVSIPGCSYICCCFSESGVTYKLEEVFTENLTKEQILNKLEDETSSKTMIIRVLGFLVHFGGVYFILYPFILLIGMIPFIGSIGAKILIFFAFIIALCTFLFIIACSWVCARPLLALFIYGFIFILYVTGKTTKESLNKEENKFNNSENFKNHSRKLLRKFY